MSPFRALFDSESYLTVFTVIEQVSGPGYYSGLAVDLPEDVIAGLVAEQTNKAGLLLLSIFVIVMFLVLAAFRVRLKLISLAKVVFQSVKYDASFPEPGDNVRRSRLGNPEDFERALDRVKCHTTLGTEQILRSEWKHWE